VVSGGVPGPDTPDLRVAARADLGDKNTPMLEIDSAGRTVFVSGPWVDLSPTGLGGSEAFEQLLESSGQATKIMDGIEGTLRQGSAHQFDLPPIAPGSPTRQLQVVPIPSPDLVGVVHALIGISRGDSNGSLPVDTTAGDAAFGLSEAGSGVVGATTEPRFVNEARDAHAADSAPEVDSSHVQDQASGNGEIAEPSPDTGFDFGSVGPFTLLAAIATVAIAVQAILTNDVSNGTMLLVGAVGAFGIWCASSDGRKTMQISIGLTVAALLGLFLLGSDSGSGEIAASSSGAAQIDDGLGARAEQGPLNVEMIAPEPLVISETQTYRAVGIAGFTNTHAIATSGDGAVLASADGRLAILDATGAVTMVIGLGGYESTFISDIAVDAEGLIWALDAGASKLYRVDLLGSVTDIPAEPGFLTNARGIAIGADSTVWVASTASGQLTQFSANGQLAGAVLVPGRQASDLFQAGDGTLWFVDAEEAELVQVSLSGEILSEITLRGFTSLESPHMAEQDGQLWLTEPEFSGVISVDTTTLEIVDEFEITRPAGESVLKPIGIAIGADGRLWVTDSMAAAVLIIDAS